MAWLEGFQNKVVLVTGASSGIGMAAFGKHARVRHRELVPVGERVGADDAHGERLDAGAQRPHARGPGLLVDLGQPAFKPFNSA